MRYSQQILSVIFHSVVQSRVCLFTYNFMLSVRIQPQGNHYYNKHEVEQLLQYSLAFRYPVRSLLYLLYPSVCAYLLIFIEFIMPFIYHLQSSYTLKQTFLTLSLLQCLSFPSISRLFFNLLFLFPLLNNRGGGGHLYVCSYYRSHSLHINKIY